MLGLLFIYYLGNSFYKLATYHEKPQWQTAIIGVVTYYAGVIVSAFGIGVAAMMLSIDIENTPDFLISLMSIPFGLLGAWLLHTYLERRWSTEFRKQDDSDLLDDNL